MVVVVKEAFTRIKIEMAASEEAAEEVIEEATIEVVVAIEVVEVETEVAVVATNQTMTNHQGCSTPIEEMRIWAAGELVVVPPATSITTVSPVTSPNSSSSNFQETEGSVEVTVEAKTTSEVTVIVVAFHVVAVSSRPLSSTSKRTTTMIRSKHQDHLSHPAPCSSPTCPRTTPKSKCSTSSKISA